MMKNVVFHYTPKHGSWLNMAEIEIGVMESQCLKKGIPDIDTMERELSAWQNARNEQRAKINWRFTRERRQVRSLSSTRNN